MCVQTRLGRTEAELGETQARLCAAKEQLQERQYVLTAQRRAEQALLAHAGAVTASLGSTARDLGALYAAWEERLVVAGADRAALSGLKDQVQVWHGTARRPG